MARSGTRQRASPAAGERLEFAAQVGHGVADPATRPARLSACQAYVLLEASSKTLLSSSEDVPTDDRAAKFEECFVNVGT
ncbi:hypothetical protein, partial [Burkholderia glumae]|uniref:hypothetical protein n=1 Tax=Burkholderia glumae TaxID=337 RepID=UPI001ABB3D5B